MQHHFSLALCLQIIVQVLLSQNAPAKGLQTTPQPSNATTEGNKTTPPAKPEDKNETSDILGPPFMTSIFCQVGNKSEQDYYLSNGLIISEHWVLSSAVFLCMLCKPFLHVQGGCLVGSIKTEIKCKEIIPYGDFSADHNLALLSVEVALPAGVVPWPKTRILLKHFDQMAFYGTEFSSKPRRLRWITIVQAVSPEYFLDVSLICANLVLLKMAEAICAGAFTGGLAVSDNVVVGILSMISPSLPECLYKTYSKPSDLSLYFTKIDDYYTFIHNVTNVTVPFESSPKIRKTVTEESSTKRTLSTKRTPAWTWTTPPITTTTTTTTTTTSTTEIFTKKEKTADLSCSSNKKPSFLVQMFCNVMTSKTLTKTTYRYYPAQGFILSKNWVLGPASQLHACRQFLHNKDGCLIGSKVVGEKCERIILHKNFVRAMPQRYDLGLVETKGSLAWLWSGETPWPGSKGFSDTCTDLSFYGYEDHSKEDYERCVTLGVASCSDSGDHRHFKRESILCGRNEDNPDLARSVCKQEFLMGLAICKNLVVGIFSHVHNDTTSSSCSRLSPLTFVLTKIEDYYSFIHDKTGLEVPFQSSPSDVDDLERRAARGTTSSAVKFNTTWWLLLLLSLLLLVVV